MKRETPPSIRDHILQDKNPDNLWATEDYTGALERLGCAIEYFLEAPECVALSYNEVVKAGENHRAEIERSPQRERIESSLRRYRLYAAGGEQGWLSWFQLRARTPA